MRLTLEDRAEIEDLFYRYAHAFDFGSEEDILEVFTADGVVDSPLRGRYAEDVQTFARWRAGRRGSGAPVERHFITNFRMEGDSKQAAVTAYFLQFNTWGTPQPPHTTPTTDFIYSGHYECIVRKVEDNWLLERRTVYIDSRPAALDAERLKSSGRGR